MLPAALMTVLACLAPAQTPARSERPKCEFAVVFKGKRPFPADDALCERMRRYKAVFERLRAAATLGPEVTLFGEPLVEDEQAPNAHYRLANRNVFVNWHYVARFEPESPAAVRTLAHELGHAVQHRDGALPYPNGLSPAEISAYSRRAEAHADMIARELMERGGFPPAALQAAVEERFGCDRIRRDEQGSATHPGAGQRWLNAVRANSPEPARLEAARARLAQAAGDGGAVFDGASSSARREPYAPSLSMADFDEQGRLRPSSLPILDRRLQPRPSTADLLATPPPSPPAGRGPFARVEPPDPFDRGLVRFAGWTLDVGRRALVPKYSVVLPLRGDDEHLARVALRACGLAPELTYAQAVRYGLDDVSRELAESMRSWLSPKPTKGP